MAGCSKAASERELRKRDGSPIVITKLSAVTNARICGKHQHSSLLATNFTHEVMQPAAFFAQWSGRQCPSDHCRSTTSEASLHLCEAARLVPLSA